MKRLLLHICCAPCSTEVVERLSHDYEITGLFYNPNIHPQGEYNLRLKEIQRFSMGKKLPLIAGEREAAEWFERTEGLGSEPEGGKRCAVCFRMRLEKTARKARESDFDLFTTTLTISPHKNSKVINEIGEGLGDKYGVKFLKEDFKKKNGFKKSIDLSRKHRLKRQDYCGCVYSKLERDSFKRGQIEKT